MTTLNTSQRLCDICRKIDFDAFLPSAHLKFPDATGSYSEPKEEAFDNGFTSPYLRQTNGTLHKVESGDFTRINQAFGTLEEIALRSKTCLLCNFVATTLKKTASVVGQAHFCVTIGQSIVGSGRDLSTELSFRFAFRTEWNLTGMTFICRDPQNTSNFQIHGRIERSFMAFVIPSPLRSVAGIPTLSARQRSALSDVSLFRSWLRICTENHTSCSNTTYKSEHTLRLIDVTEMRLRTFNVNKNVCVRYLALRYVWGETCKDFVLTRANTQDYCRPQGLPALPKTISDAILLTTQLQERYLWVDSLCIISDDPQDKAAQIPAMTSIYGCALLTIVAATGKSADDGIAGVGSQRSEVGEVDLGCYRLLLACHPLKPYELYLDPMPDTKWATRAWTYQELLLSPRSLVFFEEEAIWICRGARWLEQLDFDHPKATFRWLLEPNWTDSTLTVQNYPELVKNYVQRDLSFESDIINAFQGIMEAILGEFMWGIPLSDFGRCLMWQLGPSGVGQAQKQCGLHIPSWSWFGWKYLPKDSGPRKVRMKMFPRLTCSLTIYRWKNGSLQQTYTPNYPPSRDCTSTMRGAGQLPTSRDDNLS
jgi:hypothetical protein